MFCIEIMGMLFRLSNNNTLLNSASFVYFPFIVLNFLESHLILGTKLSFYEGYAYQLCLGTVPSYHTF